MNGGKITDNYASTELQVAHNTIIIVALMRRLGITEADIKAHEIPKPGDPACGLTIIVDANGGLVVQILQPEIADAMVEAQEHRQQ